MVSMYHVPSEESNEQIKRLENAYGEVEPNAIDIEDITVQYAIENEFHQQQHQRSEGPDIHEEKQPYDFNKQNHIDVVEQEDGHYEEEEHHYEESKDQI